MKIAALVVSALVLGAPSSALAWNGRGHKMVAAIAWQQLDPATRVRVSGLLRLNPDYEEWVAGVPAAERDRVAFLEASEWPDDIKSAPYINDGSRPPDRPEAGQNIGYSDRFQHRYWHYKNLPLSADGTPTRQPPSINAASRIEFFRTAIGAADVADGVKSYDLAWLIHLVGDVHQPLHATARFTRDHPNGDNGGNAVEVCLVTCDDGNTNLHSFWDGAMGGSERLQSIDEHVARLPEAPARRASVDSVDAWLQESLELARTVVYRSPIGGGKGAYRLTPAYRARAGATAERQIAVAGVRLANLLNRNLR